MAQNIDALEAAVTRETTVDQSAIVLLNGLAQQIKDAGVDPVKLQAVVDGITKNSDDLAAAVSANTPAA